MTDEQLAAIEQRVLAASPAPWTQEDWSGRLRDANNQSLCAADSEGTDAGLLRDKDRDFVIGAREDVPALLAEVRRLRAERDEVEALLPAVLRFVKKETGELDLVEIVRRYEKHRAMSVAIADWDFDRGAPKA